MMHGKVCGNGGVAVDGKGLRSAALNCLTVYRPAAEVITAVCGRGEGDERIGYQLCALRPILVVLIGLVIVFKTQINKLLTGISA